MDFHFGVSRMLNRPFWSMVALLRIGKARRGTPQSYAACAAVRFILARFPQYKYITSKVQRTSMFLPNINHYSVSFIGVAPIIKLTCYIYFQPINSSINCSEYNKVIVCHKEWEPCHKSVWAELQMSRIV